MKIALVCPASYPATQFGGILFLTLNIAKGLVQNNQQVTIFTSDLDAANNLHTFNPELPKNEIIDGVKISRSHVWFSIFLFYVNPGIYKVMMKNQMDIIHTVGLRSFQSLIATLVSKRKNIPLIISDQGGLLTHPDLKNSSFLKRILFKLQNLVINYTIKQSTLIIVGNEYEKKMFHKYNVNEKIRIVRNGIDLNELEITSKKNNEKRNNERFFLFVGRFHESKGLDFLLETIKNLTNFLLENKIKCVIMGIDDGFYEIMLKKIKVLEINENIIINLKPSRKEVISAYRDCEFTVLPSKWELSPLMPLEGFTFKKPCIATNVHGIPNTITDGKNGLLVEPGDIDQFSFKIKYLIQNEQIRKEMGENGFNLVQNECNNKQMVKQILRIYESVMSDKKYIKKI